MQTQLSGSLDNTNIRQNLARYPHLKMAPASSQMAPAKPDTQATTVTVTIASGKAATEFPNALAYLRGVVELPALIKFVIHNGDEMKHRIPKDLKEAPVVHAPEFKAGFNPADFTHFNTTRWVYNVIAAQVEVVRPAVKYF